MDPHVSRLVHPVTNVFLQKKKNNNNITFIQQVHIKLININNVTKASGHNL